MDEFHLSSHLWAHGDFLETHWSTRTFCSELFVIRTDCIRLISARNNKCEIQTHWRSDDWWSNVLAAAWTARLTATRSRLQPQHKSVTKVWQKCDKWRGEHVTRDTGTWRHVGTVGSVKTRQGETKVNIWFAVCPLFKENIPKTMLPGVQRFPRSSLQSRDYIIPETCYCVRRSALWDFGQTLAYDKPPEEA